MIHDLKPYPAYRNSGAMWLGEVPRHWAILPNRVLFQEVKVRDNENAEMLSVTINRGVIRQSMLLADSSKKDSSNSDKSNYKFVSPGDIVYNKMRAWQGAVGVSHYHGIVSPAYVVIRPSEGVDPEYFHYLLRTPLFAKEAERWSYGISSDQWSLRIEQFKQIYSCIPPLSEQSDIVRFLEHGDRRIQRAIRAKRRLIALLTEEKQAIIHRAVTRGLDPDVQLRSSGVEWLGDVPEHWLVTQLCRRWEVVDCKHLTVPFVDEGVPLASVQETQKFELDLSTANHTTDEWIEHMITGGREPRQGDLIYCRNVCVGAATIVTSDDKFAMGQDVCLIRTRTENNRFLNHFLHSEAMRRQLSLVLIGSTFNRINVSEIKSLVVVIPPREEQDRIVEHIDTSIVDIDSVIDSVNREIDLLLEFRTRLIADVVTGKLDVRELAAGLSEEADELTTLDDFEVPADEEQDVSADLDAGLEGSEA